MDINEFVQIIVGNLLIILGSFMATVYIVKLAKNNMKY
jgi:hypothetical protein